MKMLRTKFRIKKIKDGILSMLMIKIAVSKLNVKLRIRDFDDVVYHYIFSGWYQKYPCPAIEHLVNKKLKKYVKQN